MSKDDTLEKIRENNKRTAKKRGEIISTLWAHDETREKYLTALYNEDVKKRRIESFKKSIENNKESYLTSMRSEERKRKISESSKRMWAEMNGERKKELVPKPGGRRHIVSGVKMNKPESIVARFLNSLNISWQYEHAVSVEKLHYYPDFYVPEKNLIIEVYGDFWHANPKKYNDSYLIYEDITANEIRNRDSVRLGQIKKATKCEIMILWESDILSNLEEVLENIRSKVC
jgi:G:T-mismatch repair DNA endonuclease (very short patch repair protein)